MKKKYDLDELTPQKIVTELDRYIIGQEEAKKAVAVALRNRYRRSQLTDEQREEIYPKNLIMMGPTGVGKTEITRRIAKLVNAPLIKVEATKFTEVGYVGRDVESMVRDLVSKSVRDAEQQLIDNVREKAEIAAEEQLIDLLSGRKKEKKQQSNFPFNSFRRQPIHKPETESERQQRELRAEELNSHRAEVRRHLREGDMEDNLVTISVEEKPSAVYGMMGGGMEDMNLNEIFGGIIPPKMKERTMKVKDARPILIQQEAEKLIDKDEVTELGIRNAEQNGIIFIDEIDKIIGNENAGAGPDVSREGVQRDILPIVEGSTVSTKYGPVKTDFILFIGSGAFHGTKVSDMIPELQGRFPVDVKLDSLTRENFEEILKTTENSILKQYAQLLATEDIDLKFTDDAISEIATIAYEENMDNEDIGARRLQTVLEKLLEDISFRAPEMEETEITIDKDFVLKTLDEDRERHDYKRYLI